ncbi:MAG: glycine cleavage system aminomethyltransferase GcvT [Peptococcaceae bacterium]|nr:glycine cleavage system aminomethyltransferase GcvT [Peptococcaceae bacterium]
MEKKTPLYDNHVALGGKIVPFGGYLLPVQYETGVIKEHMAVRTEAGLFDVSHMGELMLTGPDALKNVQKVTTNDMSGMYDGQVRYSPMCNEQGGVVDDILVYKVHDEAYLLVVNASNKDKDAAWIAGHVSGDVKFEDISESVAQVALQGPNAVPILAALAADEQIPKKYYSFVKEADVKGIKCLISRTGYTGELGYELYCAAADGPKLWDLLLETGKEYGLIPCGLGARDTLRLEAAMPLYGHEMDDTVSPLETDLGDFVKLDKDDFIGKEALAAAGEPKRARIGLKVTGRGIVREHCPVFKGDMQIGMTTSGTHCPFIGMPVAMALVDSAYSEIGTEVEVEVRGRKVTAEVVPLPFYKRPKKA